MPEIRRFQNIDYFMKGFDEYVNQNENVFE